MDIGKSIRKIRREECNMNQTEFSELIGISQTYLSQIENNKKTPNISVLERMAHEANVPLSIVFWFGISEADVCPEKREHFRFLKPSIDKMIESII